MRDSGSCSNRFIKNEFVIQSFGSEPQVPEIRTDHGRQRTQKEGCTSSSSQESLPKPNSPTRGLFPKPNTAASLLQTQQEVSNFLPTQTIWTPNSGNKFSPNNTTHKSHFLRGVPQGSVFAFVLNLNEL